MEEITDSDLTISCQDTKVGIKTDYINHIAKTQRYNKIVQTFETAKF